MHLVLNIGRKYLEITGPHSDAFAKELWETVEAAGFDELVLDFTGTQIISTMAMGTIISARQKLREQNRDLRIANASEKVIRLLRAVNIEDILIEPLS